MGITPRPQISGVLIVLAKYPEPGAVKTRLATSIGAVESAAFYRALLADLAPRLLPRDEGCRFDVWWAFVPAVAPFAQFISELSRTSLPPSVHFRGFPSDGLLEQQLQLIGEARARGYDRIVIVVSDTPRLQRERIVDAFTALAHKDLVLGPAVDGGYYLLGLGSSGEIVLEHAPMSTGRVTEHILRIAEQIGYSVHILPTLPDIDSRADLDIFIQHLVAGDNALYPESTRLLRSLERQGVLPLSALSISPCFSPESATTPTNTAAVAAAIRSILSARALVQGRVVCVALPDIPERALAVQACQILGLQTEQIALPNLTDEALRGILRHTHSPLLIVPDWWVAPNRAVPIKLIADRSAVSAPELEAIIVVRYVGRSVSWLDGRDYWWHDRVNR